MFRYFLQFQVRLADLIFIGMCVFAVFFCWNIFPINALVVFLIVKNFKTWNGLGGFEAWNPRTARENLENMKRMGL